MIIQMLNASKVLCSRKHLDQDTTCCTKHGMIQEDCINDCWVICLLKCHKLNQISHVDHHELTCKTSQGHWWTIWINQNDNFSGLQCIMAHMYMTCMQCNNVIMYYLCTHTHLQAWSTHAQLLSILALTTILLTNLSTRSG